MRRFMTSSTVISSVCPGLLPTPACCRTGRLIPGMGGPIPGKKGGMRPIPGMPIPGIPIPGMLIPGSPIIPGGYGG